LESLNPLLNFLIAIGNELLVLTVGGHRLLQRENVFRAVIADEAFFNGVDGSFNPVVAQLG